MINASFPFENKSILKTINHQLNVTIFSIYFFLLIFFH